MAKGRRSVAHLLHEAFATSLLLKGLFAAAETLSGLLLFFVHNDTIRAFIRWATTHELTEDPNDRLAGLLLQMAHSLSIETQDFYAVYLVGHGILKLAVVLLLARGFLWSYPMGVVVLSGFIVYQLHRYLLQPSYGLILLTILDLVVIALTVIEYLAVKSRK